MGASSNSYWVTRRRPAARRGFTPTKLRRHHLYISGFQPVAVREIKARVTGLTFLARDEDHPER